MSRLEQLLVGTLVLIALAAAGWLGLQHYGEVRFEAGRAGAIAEREAADALAVLTRTKENSVKAAQQSLDNLNITEKKHEEIAPVRERIVTQRVYVGTGLCGERPAAPAEADSSGSSDGTDPPGRLVRQDVERDLVALKLAVEEDLATGRACQGVLEQEGMMPANRQLDQFGKLDAAAPDQPTPGK
jgi:prophage endopeptidase